MKNWLTFDLTAIEPEEGAPAPDRVIFGDPKFCINFAWHQHINVLMCPHNTTARAAPDYLHTRRRGTSKPNMDIH